MEKIKLLFINGHLNTGGVEKALLDILRHLDYDRYEVDLLLTEELGDYVNQLPSQVNVILRSLEGTFGSFVKVMGKSVRSRDWFSLRMRLIFLLMRFLGISKISLAKKMLTEKKEYDCVIGFRRGICTQIANFAVNAKKRITWWHHGEINVEKKAYLQEVSHCDYIVAVSNACRDMLLKEMPTLKDRTVMIHNMLDEKTVKEKATLFDPQFDESKLHIVSVGRLSPEKHFENAVYAAKVLKENSINFQWHLIGDGAEGDRLKALAKQYCVDDVFLFEGNQVNPYPYVQRADSFAHPSYVESFGLVVAEALALGRACVVTKSEGVMDFLQDGRNAVLTQQDPADFASKLIKILGDTDLYKKISTEAKVPKEFLPKAVCAKIDEIILN